MVRRIIAALTVLAMLIALTACGHTHEDTDSDGVCNGCGEKMSTTPEDDKPSGEGDGSDDKDGNGTESDTDGEGDGTPDGDGDTNPPDVEDTPTPPGGGGVIDTPKDEF